mgnify:CR=1 FL=1
MTTDSLPKKNWTPNQIWANSMNDDSNPLSNFNDAGDGLDMDEWEFYGEDPSGPLPFEESNNNEW